MPELPEVEIQKRGLHSSVSDTTILKVVVLYNGVISDVKKRLVEQEQVRRFRDRLVGLKILSVQRIAKHIVFCLNKEYILLSHLKMTGQWQVTRDLKTIPTATRLYMQLDNGMYVLFRDTRKFGFVLLQSSSEHTRYLQSKRYGLEPLSSEFGLAEFKLLLTKKAKSSLKSALLAQTAVVGLGNIYVDELCFRTAVRPTRRVYLLKEVEIEKIFTEIPLLLSQAIAAGGSSLTSGNSQVAYRNIHGETGGFHAYHQVYGKSGQACPVCTSTLCGTKVGGRTTVYCNHCQS